MNQTITLTIGEQSEAYNGMERIGKGIYDKGLSHSDLQIIKKYLKNKYENIKVEICKLENDDLINYSFNNGLEYEDAYILIIRKGVNILMDDDKYSDNIMEEQINLDWDKKAYMRGRVVNKRARYNLCYSDNEQEPDYDNKKGRIIKYSDIPYSSKLKIEIENILNDSLLDIHPSDYSSDNKFKFEMEGNYYFDNNKCGISYHGDGERKIVIAIRLGDTVPIVYRWYHKSKPIDKYTNYDENNNYMKFDIDGGDIYIMSEKATGYDWLKKNILTLRHAAGANKFINIK